MSKDIFRDTTPEGGVIRLMKWPEGYELWHHGRCVWRSAKPVPAPAVPVHTPAGTMCR